MTIFGYARVSTPQQSLERQERNIRALYPDAIILSESWTGTEMSRPVWDRLMHRAKAGDTIVFDSVSRMSRTASEGVEVYMTLMNGGIDLVYLKEPHINTTTYKDAIEKAKLPYIATGEKSTDTLIKGIFQAVEQYMEELAKKQIVLAFEQSEKEVLDLRQRTKEGIETARIHGKKLGRPVGSGHEIITKKEKEMLPLIKKMSKSFDGTLSDSECMQVLGLARGTFYKYKRKLKAKSI